jgi:outer membrane protein assembly factor BamB
MDIGLKKAALIITAVVLIASVHTAVKRNNIPTNGQKEVYAEPERRDVILHIEGPEPEGDSVAVMSVRSSRRLQRLTYEAYDKDYSKKLGFKAYTDKAVEGRGPIRFGDGESYSVLKGVTTFRGNNMRDGGSYGYADVKEEKLKVLWEKGIGGIDSWTGVGWNGQPAIVQWEPEVLGAMNIKEGKKNVRDLKEVIYATMDGNIYFMDLEDGKATRDILRIGAPVKGSVTIDPRGFPLLYVGQGIDRNGSTYVDFAYRIFSLVDFKKLYEIKGRDGFARRNWGAFDSNPLIDRHNDYLFICGENGVVYSGKLNTRYEDGKISIAPKIDKYRYDAAGKYTKGIENSIAAYENYGYFADNDGILQCLDLNTLKPVWAVDVNDDTDATVVLERHSKGLSLYTACEVDRQGSGGYSYIRKLDGTSGQILWERKYRCAYDSHTNGGALATPIVGKNEISNLVIFSIAKTPDLVSGLLLALDKESGEEVWKLKLPNYCWSSPVGIYTSQGKSYIIQCDSVGRAMLIEGISGKILDTINLGSNVEGTPAVFGNKIVVGTRGRKIIGFEVK